MQVVLLQVIGHTMSLLICDRDIEHKVHDGRVYWTQGNNAQPVADGRCCDKCDMGVVIPTRLSLAIFGENILEEE